ncbi:hypothetical protein [Streptomyces sp. NBC_01294]|uniref:hypothetical protein n=1 Tax=Streptomyces sp. NBC_01294 TaxID=2903815 RepID=UPI002DDAAD06|nr:hypothetical protein [Streptomyces sp. NBC_01294]WRZ62338.1 hypothetical protein OG534_38450 [Streptomyces sp. NBC_01294]
MRLLFGWVPVDDRAWEVQTPPDAEAFAAAAALDEDEMEAGFVEQVAAVEVAALRHDQVVAVALPRPAAPCPARVPFAAGEDQGRPVQGEDRPRAYGTEYATPQNANPPIPRGVLDRQGLTELTC